MSKHQASAATASLTGDALILALAAAYREATVAVEASDVERLNWEGTMHDYMDRQNSAHSQRRDAIEAAICAIPADGLPGAMVQVEALFLIGDRGSFLDDDARARVETALMRAATWSVYNVMSRATGLKTSDCLEVMPSDRDDLRTDVGGLVAELQAMIEASGSAVERRVRASEGAAA